MKLSLFCICGVKTELIFEMSPSEMDLETFQTGILPATGHMYSPCGTPWAGHSKIVMSVYSHCSLAKRGGG